MVVSLMFLPAWKDAGVPWVSMGPKSTAEEQMGVGAVRSEHDGAGRVCASPFPPTHPLQLFLFS